MRLEMLSLRDAYFWSLILLLFFRFILLLVATTITKVKVFKMAQPVNYLFWIFLSQHYR